MNYTVQEIQEKIDKLREEYKNKAGVDRKMIEIRGKLLKIALEKKMERQQKFL